MRNELRFVFDTNVSVSAAIFKNSVPDLALSGAFALGVVLMSVETIQELEEVLHRSKFSRFANEAELELFVSKLVERGLLIDTSVVIQACRDSKDNKILELAVSGNATHIVTGDVDLLMLNPFRGISILKPSELLLELGFSGD